jgi:hypothetical protein
VLETLISANHDEIVARVNVRVDAGALASSIPLVLRELLETLRRPSRSPSLQEIGVQQALAARRAGLSVSHLLRSYAEICRVVTDLALERGATIGAAEFGTFRRCLDAGIASSVTEYGRQRDQLLSQMALAEATRIAHDLRNQLAPALLAFSALRAGLGLDGVATQVVLEHSLNRLRGQVGRLLSEVRVKAHTTVRAPPAATRPPLAKAPAAASPVACRQAH